MSERAHFNKLVRDKIPKIIEEKNGVPTTRILDPEEYRRALLEKLIEEAKELLADPGYEERADVAEVLKALDKVFDWAEAEIESTRQDKYKRRGGFEKRIFLEYVDE